MTVEYVLLVTLFVSIMMRVLISAPVQSFKTSAPKLGARVEQHLSTGVGFKTKGKPHTDVWAPDGQ